jgi:hypothetical protein
MRGENSLPVQSLDLIWVQPAMTVIAWLVGFVVESFLPEKDRALGNLAACELVRGWFGEWAMPPEVSSVLCSHERKWSVVLEALCHVEHGFAYDPHLEETLDLDFDIGEGCDDVVECEWDSNWKHAAQRLGGHGEEVADDPRCRSI